MIILSTYRVPHPVPEIKWEESEVTIPEGDNRQVCFNSNIGTAQPYVVTVEVRGKGDSPATRGISPKVCHKARH